ncbi:hypothetical protein I8J29_18705 [Paenibacillus sp. MWE-103]|uniref:Uncharacterized protein n=1 Tax=Paenibacillus artemisiicola TaxID=1172618 RepID=A0ABS3WD55_9BACL|nr:hypothetical protein [Paenibacillus artemisiicola]MBO7746243.1 hypothetical protein [Paenibacillus artemisiicola]
MFGNKKDASFNQPEQARVVPVYTVHTLPRPYEVLCTVYSGKVGNGAPLNVLQQLGRAGGAIPECDAVIGILVTPAATLAVVHAYGTAIRYTG